MGLTMLQGFVDKLSVVVVAAGVLAAWMDSVAPASIYCARIWIAISYMYSYIETILHNSKDLSVRP